MATLIWVLQGTTPTTIEATDLIHFANGTFDGAITVGAYNDSTHVENSGGTEDSASNTPKNSKYLTSSTVDIGGGSVALSSVSEANCPLKLTFTHESAVAVTNHKIYAYDGTTTTSVPTGVTFQIAEQGDEAWTNAEGSAAALNVADSGSAESHDFFFLISASPESVGEKTAFAIRSEFTYS